MVAHDARRALDSAQILGPEILGALRTALAEQRAAGPEPIAGLQRAITAAAKEARARDLAPEALLIQLKALADEIGIKPADPTITTRPLASVREWMVRTLLVAYWQTSDE